MEKETKKQNKKSNKGKILFAIALLVLAYMFIFRPLVVSHCQGRADKEIDLFASPRTVYEKCVKEIDPLQELQVFLFGDY